MKTFNKITIITLVIIFSLITVMGLFGQPEDTCQHWFLTFLLSKIIGLTAGFITFGLVKTNYEMFKEMIDKFQ